MKQKPNDLMSKLYEYWSPHIDEEEMTYYREAIERANGKVLDVACAAGRLLLPFLKEGFDIEGVDSSPAMLDLLRKKAVKAKLNPTLYCQKLEDFDLKTTYRLIYISLGSIQLMKDRDDVKNFLQKCYRNLEEGGELVVSFFIPWAVVSIGAPGWRIVSDVTNWRQNLRYIRRENILLDPVEQTIAGQIRFEVWQGKFLFEMQEREIFLRWYSKEECIAFLKEAGFSTVTMERNYKKGTPPRPAFMLFNATK